MRINSNEQGHREIDMARTGLGIADFLKHSDDANSSGGGKWLKQWRKKLPGEVTIWLHTRAPIVATCTHSFAFEDEVTDRETGRKKSILRFPRWVSPDSEVVHKNQYFREDDGTLQVLPDRDPFLLLREWLRFQDNLALDEVVFKWNDEKNRKQIVWERGHLTGQVKRGQQNFNHSLDTKTDYVYVVVDNDAPDAGPVLAREGKLLSKKMSDVIKHQRKTFGEVEGDPIQHPYAIQWVAEDANSPMDMYKAYKAERAELTDEIWAAISGDDFPDPLPFGEPGDGDFEKIRDAMEAAMQIELPLDQIFSEDPAVRRAVAKPGAAVPRQAARQSKAAQAKQSPAAARPPAPTTAAKPATRPAAAAKPAQHAPTTAAGIATLATAVAAAVADAKPAAGPQTRRRKVDPPAEPQPEPEPEPTPEVESIACEECGASMLVTDAKCEGCGAEYEVDAEPPPPPAAKPAVKPAATKPKPVTKPKAEEPAAAESGEGKELKCWSCGEHIEDDKELCPHCGIDLGDDVPF